VSRATIAGHRRTAATTTSTFGVAVICSGRHRICYRHAPNRPGPARYCSELTTHSSVTAITVNIRGVYPASTPASPGCKR
jgi:hypothetical protein